MNRKIISIFLMAIMCMSIPISFAENTNNFFSKYESQKKTSLSDYTIVYDDENDTYDDIDYNQFTATSKIAYETLIVLTQDLGYDSFTGDIPWNMSSFADLKDFFYSIGINSTVASNVTKEDLKVGDIVQMQNSNSAFLIYTGIDADGDIQLEDISYAYECSPQSFDLLFTGNALLNNHSSSKISLIDGQSIKNVRIQSNSTKIGPMLKGKSTKNKILASWDNLKDNPKIKKIAAGIHQKGDSQLDKIKNIWDWFRGLNGFDRHMQYHLKKDYHENTDKHKFNTCIDSGYGNCCEQARIFVAIARASNIQAQYIHLFKTKKSVGHVFTRERYDDTAKKWIMVDTTNKNGWNRGTNGRAYEIINYNELAF